MVVGSTLPLYAVAVSKYGSYLRREATPFKWSRLVDSGQARAGREDFCIMAAMERFGSATSKMESRPAWLTLRPSAVIIAYAGKTYAWLTGLPAISSGTTRLPKLST